MIPRHRARVTAPRARLDRASRRAHSAPGTPRRTDFAVPKPASQGHLKGAISRARLSEIASRKDRSAAGMKSRARKLDRAGARMRPSRRGMGARVTSMRASRATARSSRDRRASGHLNNVRHVRLSPMPNRRRRFPRSPPACRPSPSAADESGMRLDRFFEARFPGLSFSHIQRIIRKGEVRVNGKRADPKDRLEVGQQIRIPPLKLNRAEARRRASPPRTKRRATFSSRSRCTRMTTCWC